MTEHEMRQKKRGKRKQERTRKRERLQTQGDSVLVLPRRERACATDRRGRLAVHVRWRGHGLFLHLLLRWWWPPTVVVLLLCRVR